MWNAEPALQRTKHGVTMGSNPDVMVLGAGVVGLSTARRLAAGGLSVTVLDPSSPGGRGSRAAAGVAVPSIRLFENPRMLAFAQAGEVTLQAELAELGVELRRGRGVMRLALDERIREALAALHARFPGPLGEWVDATGLARLEPALEGTPALGAYVTSGGFMVDTEAYLQALLAQARARGVQLLLGQSALRVEEHPGSVRVWTEGGLLETGTLVVAAGAWSGTVPGLEPLPVVPLRGQMLTVRAPGFSLQHVLSGAMYLAPWRAGEIVVGATEEKAGFVAAVTPAGLMQLAHTVVKVAPALREAQVTGSWAGLRSATPDGEPLLGRYPRTQRVWVASGHGGQGILTGAETGAAVAELVQTGKSHWAELFSPARLKRVSEP